MIIKKWSEKIKQNLNAIAEDFSLKKTVYIQGSPAFCQAFFPYKPHTQTFLTCLSKWGRYSNKFWMSSLFIHVTNFKIIITNLNSKFCIYYLNNFLEERSSTIYASSPHNLGMKNWNQEVRSDVSHYTTFHKT